MIFHRISVAGSTNEKGSVLNEYVKKGGKVVMDAVEEKIAAIKALFVPFDLEVEVVIRSNTETDDDGGKDKYYSSEVVYVNDDWKDLRVRFVAYADTKKIDDASALQPCTASEHLIEALDDLYRLCRDAMQRKYGTEIWDD